MRESWGDSEVPVPVIGTVISQGSEKQHSAESEAPVYVSIHRDS